MRKKKKKKKVVRRKKARRRESETIRDTLDLQNQYEELRKQIDSLWDVAEKSEERLQDIEIHINLLTRLFTTLCVEKFGMRVGVLKRFIKRIEKEAIRDSQINHLEALYKLTHAPGKKKRPPSKKDPWDDIS